LLFSSEEELHPMPNQVLKINGIQMADHHPVKPTTTTVLICFWLGLPVMDYVNYVKTK